MVRRNKRRYLRRINVRSVPPAFRLANQLLNTGQYCEVADVFDALFNRALVQNEPRVEG